MPTLSWFNQVLAVQLAPGEALMDPLEAFAALADSLDDDCRMHPGMVGCYGKTYAAFRIRALITRLEHGARTAPQSEASQ